MLTLLGFNSFRLLCILDEGFPIHTLQRKGHGAYFPKRTQQKNTTNTYNKFCTRWNSKGARLMSLFSTIMSICKTSLRIDIIVETRTLILCLGCSTQDKTKTPKNAHNKYTHHIYTTNRHNNYTQQIACSLCERTPLKNTRVYM
jgi:hypothetical protein